MRSSTIVILILGVTVRSTIRGVSARDEVERIRLLRERVNELWRTVSAGVKHSERRNGVRVYDEG